MLKITDLSVAIEQTTIIQNLNLCLEPGSIHALMGPNGSGKSSLAYTLIGHPRYTVRSGSISFCGNSIIELSPDKRAKLGIFLAFQHPPEVPGVQVASFLKEIYSAVTGRTVTVAEFNLLLHEIFTILGIDPSFAYRNLNEGFSGGEKKRLEMVQMLLLKPHLVILDEIDSGLDIDALKVVANALHYLRTINPTVTLLIITHYQRILTHIVPEYVHVLMQGSLLRSGTHHLAQELELKGYDGIVAN